MRPDALTDFRDPKKYIPNPKDTYWPGRPDESRPGDDPNKIIIPEDPGKNPGWPKGIDPDEFNRRPAGRYNPHNMRPIDPEFAKEYPLNAEGRPYDPKTGDILPGVFDPKTGQPIDPETGKPVPKAFDPMTGRPIDPQTGEAYPIDKATKYPVNPVTKEPHQASWTVRPRHRQET